MRYTIFAITIAALTGCSQPKREAIPEPETTGFSGQPLYSRPADSIATVRNDSLIKAVRSKSQLSEDDYIAIGRSLVTVGQFRKAVEKYTEGLARFPDSYKLLRYRGHRYINLRELDNAIADLTRAAALMPEAPEFELDATGKQGASFQHQVWYHIGLYHFLKRDYVKGAEACEKSLATAYVGTDKAGASDWLYNCYMRSGQKEKAMAVAKPFTEDFEIDNKDYPYYRRLLLFNGVIQPGELVDATKPPAEMDLNDMTKLYGLANFHLYSGDSAAANILYKNVLQANHWQGFAYACAELDVKE